MAGKSTPGTGKGQNAGKTGKKGAGKDQAAPTKPKTGGKGGGGGGGGKAQGMGSC